MGTQSRLVSDVSYARLMSEGCLDQGFSGVYFALAMCKFVQFARIQVQPLRGEGPSERIWVVEAVNRKWWKFAPTLHLFIRDGAFYFLMYVATILFPSQ